MRRAQMTSFCVICSDGELVHKEVFWKEDWWDRSYKIALTIAKAAETFKTGEFNVHIIELKD